MQTVLSITGRHHRRSSVLKVYVSVLDKSKSKDAIKGLKSAGGYLRQEISSGFGLRYTPELLFEGTTPSIRRAIFDLLSKLAPNEVSRTFSGGGAPCGR